MAIFNDCIAYVLKNEGGFSYNPGDRGGATNMGITQDTLAHWRRLPVSVRDVRFLSEKEAQEIYRSFYWQPLGLSFIEAAPVATAILDMGVNFGVHGGAILSQVASGCLPSNADGKMSQLNLRAINQMTPRTFVENLSVLAAERYAYIISRNPSQEIFRNGWLQRAHRLMTLVPV